MNVEEKRERAGQRETERRELGGLGKRRVEAEGGGVGEM